MKLSDRPIFVVGSPRSGTSLMVEMLDGHPNLFVPHWETGLFIRFDEMLNGHLDHVLQFKQELFPFERAEIIQWMRESVEALFSRFAEKCGKWRWVEKTPAHVFHMATMHETFPKAQFIHMIRDGRDVVRSLQSMSWAPRKIRWSIKNWMNSVDAGRKVGRTLPPGQYIEVTYEKMIADAGKTLEQLCAFLGETYSPRMLAFHLPENNSWSASFPPVRNKPINDHPHLGFLQRVLFKVMAGRFLKELGYV